MFIVTVKATPMVTAAEKAAYDPLSQTEDRYVIQYISAFSGI